ncbi:M20 aminoacylase family protein [Psychrobacter sp. JB385]|uniref:M20 aminoacylase family protein n=1 Tax=Psychrobacter sp. JB385 TaxID=1434841 RepID=UPI00097F1CFF|nr:M20 aminoacylase family protein [Psychrobacter sp. JB385]SJN22104.1 N-acetyl-L,L-diaminopimelate deacetylase [Psychrobacter sp. JB385]
MLINETLLGEVKQWRQQIHSQPELGFKEFKTSSFIVDKLQSFGIEVHQGLGGTGVVGVLKNGSGPTIGIRADIDALPIKEQNDIAHKSTHDNCMHACGHDGHTSVLLGTAKHLSQHKNFSGTIYFIFQPAEEVLGGAKAMIDDGLFDKFPMDAVYGLHNWPGLPVGEIAVNNGPMMASFDTFEITLTGKGTHAAMPHLGADPIAAGAALITNIQSIVSRRISPLKSGVISVTQMNSGDTTNVIPDYAILKGTVRSFDMDVRQSMQDMLTEMVTVLPPLYGVTGEMDYHIRYPVTTNDSQAYLEIKEAATNALGADKVNTDVEPSMASEDFSFMSQVVKGAYFWLGVDGSTPSKPLHNAAYDFNDDAIETGIKVWVSLVESQLPKMSA